MKEHTRAKLKDFARSWRKASALHRFPLIWVDLVYIWYLCARTDDTVHFLCITFLMVMHADLYLLATRTTFNAHSSLPYLVMQSFLLLAISFLAGNWVIALGLYVALAVKIVELLERAEPHFGSALAYLQLSVVALSIDWLLCMRGQSGLNWIYSMPFFLCAVCSGLLFLRQAYGRKCMQQLLHNVRDGYTELFASHTALVTRHAQLAASLVEIEEAAQMGERQRLARELHDTLTQDLVSIILQLEAIDGCLANEQAQRAREIVQLATQRARSALDGTRHAIYDLRAQRAAQNGLTQSVQAEIRRLSQTTGILCLCDLRPFATLPVLVGEQILQAIKEGLANVARHANARQVWIGLRNSGSTCVLEIRDDGQGFDPTYTAVGHYGLLGLRERAQQLGGELHICSAPGEGTRLSMCLPRGYEEREVCFA